MISPGQSDRMHRLIEEGRDRGMSLVDAIRAAQETVAQEDAVCRALPARRVSGRVMNDTEMDLMCRGDTAGVARLARIREIERQHRGK